MLVAVVAKIASLALGFLKQLWIATHRYACESAVALSCLQFSVCRGACACYARMVEAGLTAGHCRLDSLMFAFCVVVAAAVVVVVGCAAVLAARSFLPHPAMTACA